MDFYQKHYSSDIDAYNEETASWQLDFRQLDCGPFQGMLFQYGYHDAIIGNARFNRKIDQHGAAPPGLITFAILNRVEAPIIWRGTIVDNDMVMVYRPGDEIDCSSKPGFHVAAYSISEQLFLEHCHNLGVQDRLTANSNKKVFPINPTSSRRIIELIESANRRAFYISNPFEDSSLRELLETQIACQFIEAIAESRNIVTKSPLTPRSQKTLVIIEESFKSNASPTTVRDLCELTGVSERTLQYLFRWKYDITPKTYLKRMRLNAVHRSLRRASSQQLKIADIANQMGFWHMGQFAKDYRQLFGDLPSDTRKNPN